MSKQPAGEMPFLDHLEELRARLAARLPPPCWTSLDPAALARQGQGRRFAGGQRQ